MYAIIRTGGKQYQVAAGQTLQIEKLPQSVGAFVKFSDVLLIEDDGELYLGFPQMQSAEVVAQVLGQRKAGKIHIIKFKRRKHHMKRMGHRQYFTTVKVMGISFDKRKEVSVGNSAASVSLMDTV
ncbi:50S ribosomal protein L21 [Coxiella endosymbiont of Amblyomma sculptum]|uniref:50S ribosomal protein L21 n=1 Tax=Coxiella endosymbiont of Amblyomma sculptum TaxID=2487929 RepID=UPI00132F4806|nr:50S ribosomal protein L21 [Coxiella endosymbiont of Amblyomma sculptum]QHG92709.1 50S ribosomal protein L21 [Coxiella endosymbiont of Amblyomma sculptum]